MSYINTKIFINNHSPASNTIYEVIFYEGISEVCWLVSSQLQKDDSYIDIFLPKRLIHYTPICFTSIDLLDYSLKQGVIEVDLNDYIDILLKIKLSVSGKGFYDNKIIKQGIEDWIFNG